ncbi:MAG: RNA-guided pseudouridylation complex pseudouridine synthase subunit Cbf5 [Nanoarchaeota archaeon]|nr:RNA-guided pseudouridylation complex pseudouridine synthase subunit Cbf5 [Nanoarchaeota archaeon]
MVDIKKIQKEKPIEDLINFSIINVDKCSGPTSFGVDIIVKKSLGLNKTSHAGTLDPKVTGVLPVMLGRACKLLGYFMGHNKTYVGIMRLHKEIDEKKLKEEMQKFVGKIKQTPPVRSRVARREREREVFSWDILEIDNARKPKVSGATESQDVPSHEQHEDSVGRDVLFETEVEAGTYIRKLISDLGEVIGGAHMLELRRTKAGIFEEKDIVNLYDVEKAVKLWKEKNDESLLREILVPGEIISKILPVVEINEKNLKKLWTGKPLFKEDVVGELEEDKFVGFIGDRFVGVYRKVKEGGIIARPEFVFN